MLRLDEEGGNVVDWDFLHKYTVGFDAESMPAIGRAPRTTSAMSRGEYDGKFRKHRSGPRRSAARRWRQSPVRHIAVEGKQGHDVQCLRLHAPYRYGELGAARRSPVNSMGGHYGKPGAVLGRLLLDGGSDAPCNLILTGSRGVDEAKEKLGIAPKKMLGEPCDDVVSAAQVWDAIFNKKYHFTGDIRNDAPESACEERDLTSALWISARGLPCAPTPIP